MMLVGDEPQSYPSYCDIALASEASYEDLKAAMTWAEGQDDIIVPAKHPLAGRAALLYEIITADEDIWGENHRT